MLFAGISWGLTGYEVDIVGADGREVTTSVHFDAGRTDEMIAELRDTSHNLVAIIDSTNGVLDGRMMAAGLTVYRADPEVLPERPSFGSVGADILARLGQQHLRALTRLERHRGTQTGREVELNATIATSSRTTDILASTGHCLRHGSRHRREIALTFDDGPLRPYTGQILDVLQRYGVCATFFCVGINVSTHSDYITRMHAEGHAIGNHTWSHPFLQELSRPQLIEQIRRTGETIAEARDGKAPTLFRPPYGSRTPEAMGWITEIDSTIVLWEIDPSDWAMPGSRSIAETVVAECRPGSIVVLHDGGGDRSQTVAALPALIEGLLQRGFSFALVQNLATVVLDAKESIQLQ